MLYETSKVLDIELEKVKLEGDLNIPKGASGIVVFAHGSGSSRKSPRNNFVAETLQQQNIGTLLFDLLTQREDQLRANRFDIPLLTNRLSEVTSWLMEREDYDDQKIGYFGSSTGAASALKAAVERKEQVSAVVSRGGRVDMASDVVADVEAATLLIVGGRDTQVLEWNKDIYSKLNSEKKLVVIEGAGHLFSGPGELEDVAKKAADWFEYYLK